MLKLIGGVLVGISGVAVGISAGMSVKRRASALESWVRALHIMKTEIVLRREPMDAVAARLSSEAGGEAGRYFGKISSLMTEGKSFREAREEADIDLCRSSLGSFDVEAFSRALDAAGRYGAAVQAQVFSDVSAELEERLAEAREDRDKKAGLYQALGVCGGVMMVLMVI